MKMVFSTNDNDLDIAIEHQVSEVYSFDAFTDEGTEQLQSTITIDGLIKLHGMLEVLTQNHYGNKQTRE